LHLVEHLLIVGILWGVALAGGGAKCDHLRIAVGDGGDRVVDHLHALHVERRMPVIQTDEGNFDHAGIPP
jgi:hypothetical protein